MIERYIELKVSNGDLVIIIGAEAYCQEITIAAQEVEKLKKLLFGDSKKQRGPKK